MGGDHWSPPFVYFKGLDIYIGYSKTLNYYIFVSLLNICFNI